MRTRTRMPPTALERESGRRPDTSEPSSTPFDDFLDGGKPKRAPRGSAVKFTPYEIAVRDAETRAKSGEWSDAKAPTLVGLYAVAHRMTYGCLPDELEDALEFKLASRLVSSFLAAEFGNDTVALVAMIRWIWQREKGRAKWNQDNGREVRRLRWRFVFSKSALGDFRVAVSARGRSTRA